MILLDFSNIIVGSIMVSSRVPDEERFSENFIRHLVLNSIRSYRKKYREKYGEMVICTDYLSSWRKDVFPYIIKHHDLDTVIFQLSLLYPNETNAIHPY